jgi:hypothetical protein
MLTVLLSAIPLEENMKVQKHRYKENQVQPFIAALHHMDVLFI